MLFFGQSSSRINPHPEAEAPPKHDNNEAARLLSVLGGWVWLWETCNRIWGGA